MLESAENFDFTVIPAQYPLYSVQQFLLLQLIDNSFANQNLLVLHTRFYLLVCFQVLPEIIFAPA